jgi:predicted lipid-binding transport protein (Tim44 family)
MTSRPARAFPARLLALALAVAVAALAAGCAPSQSSSNSTSKFKGDARLAAQAVEDLQSAASDGDNDKICTQILARAFAGKLAAAGHGCPATVDAAVDDADTIDMTVERVSVDGDQATARVKLETGKKDRHATFQLVRENRRWKISGF